MSGLCSLLALTEGIRRNSRSSERCSSRRPSINSVRFIEVLRHSDSLPRSKVKISQKEVGGGMILQAECAFGAAKLIVRRGNRLHKRSDGSVAAGLAGCGRACE